MNMTKDQAQMLTTLATACRPNGARRWDEAGVMAALQQVAHRDLAAVVMATIRAASDRDVETPGVIPSNGSHWSESAAVSVFVPKTVDRSGCCSVCSMTEVACRMRWGGDHEFESIERAAARKGAVDIERTVAALKSEVIPVAPPPVPKSLDERVADIPPAQRDPGCAVVVQAMSGPSESAASAAEMGETA